MSINSLQLENVSQYLSVLSSPMFLNAVKSASQAEGSGKFDSLLSSLEKLSSLLPTDSSASLPPESSLNVNSLLGSTPNTSSSIDEGLKQNMLSGQTLGEVVDNLIANADLLESMLNLDVIPSTDALGDLLSKFRAIISGLDKEVNALRRETKSKESKSELQLRPSNSTKSGFQESLTLTV